MSAASSTFVSEWFFEQLAGDSSVVERSAAHGAMPPLLCRDEDEAVRVVEGTVTFYVDGEVVTAGRGDVVVAPRGAQRTFRVESSHARWLVLTRLRSPARFRDFGRAVGAPARCWPSAAEHASVAAMASANGIELLGPPGALPT